MKIKLFDYVGWNIITCGWSFTLFQAWRGNLYWEVFTFGYDPMGWFFRAYDSYDQVANEMSAILGEEW